MSVIMARFLPLLIITTSILPANILVNIDGMIGKRAEWNMDENLDSFVDGSILAEDIQKVQDPENSSQYTLSCKITVTNDINKSVIEMSNVNFSWLEMEFFNPEIYVDQDYMIGVFAGVVRKYVTEPITVDGENYTAGYDRSTGLLLSVFIEDEATTQYEDHDIYLLRIHSTSVFFNMVDAQPYIIGIGIAVGAIAILFTVSVLVTDRKKRSVMACFDPECWE